MIFRAYIGISCTHLVINKLLSCFRFSFLVVMISLVAACSSGGGDGEKTITYYLDSDGDGYGDPASTQSAASQPAGYVTNKTDCDDSSAAINPAAVEANDGIDNNCDGQVDEGFVAYYQDSDGDSYGDPASTLVANSQPTGYVVDNTDCDDGSATVNPGAAETIDGIDNNCNGQVDEASITYYQDSDGDGYGNPANTQSATSQPAGYVTNNTDCDDSNAAVNPGAAEISDGIDNNCDGQVDEGFITYYLDADGDGHGNPAVTQIATSPPAGYVSNNNDCDDSDVAVHPGATEVNDGIDNNCNGQIDESQNLSLLYQQLDDALAQKNVATDSPDGLWIIYGKGVTDYQSVLTSGSHVRDEAINLFAFVVSVYVLDDLGTLRVALNRCSGEYSINNVWANAAQGSASFNEFTMNLQGLKRMASTLYPFNPGDTLLSADYQAYLDTDFNVTLVNNNEMIFPMDFTFTDNTGDVQGSFTATFKGRKISDDYNTNLGPFLVNSINRDSQCFTYLNQSNDEVSTTSVQGQNFVTESNFVWEKFSIQTYPNQADGISYLLYQDRSAFTFMSNGQSIPTERLTTVSLQNTNGLFPNTTAYNNLGSHLLDLTYNFNVSTGLTMDYAISDGTNTLTGTVEALY